MAQITIEVPEPLAEKLVAIQDRLPEVLAHGLDQLSPVPNAVYRYILEFLARNPSAQEVLDFKLTPMMQERVSALLGRSRENELTETESAELDEYERLNRFVRKFKIQAMKELKTAP